ncbi:hypothetical protein TNCV_1219861 [Trichonephila clavipes]|nr:hypothetical protein TNCV_1219861 [Trichonephila clavipes]
MFEKGFVLLDCPTEPSEEFVEEDDDNECTALIIADNVVLVFVKTSKSITEADSGYEKEMNSATPVSEMKDIMKSMQNYSDTHSRGEMNNKMDDVEQFVAKRDNAKNNFRLLLKI